MNFTDKNGYYKILDAFKGIAILLVVATHTSQMYELPVFLKRICEFGQMGCQLFLVISGFNLMNSWIKKNISVSKFYINRWLSLAPGYWITILFFFSLNILRSFVGKGMPISSFAKGSLVNLFLLNGFIPKYNNNIVPGGWYVGTTVILYLLFPAIGLFMHKNIEKRNMLKSYVFPGFCALILGCIIGVINYATTNTVFLENNSFLYFSVANQFPCFLCGIILYFRLQDINAKQKRDWKCVLLSIILLIFSFLLFNSTLEIRYYFVPILTSISVALLLEYFMTIKVEGLKVFRLLGKESYGIYLIHSIFSYQLSAIVEQIIGMNNVFVFVPMYILIVIFSLAFGRCINYFANKVKKLKFR